MKYRTKSFLLWALAFVLMASAAVYQRMTGPTYPVSGEVEIDGQPVVYKLIRTWEGQTDARIFVELPDEETEGYYRYRRYKSHDEWNERKLIREDGGLAAYLPGQPAAGKVMYQVFLTKNGHETALTHEPLILRYKGVVPASVLIPHIFIIFLAMMFSVRTGFEALIRGKHLVRYAMWTVILLSIGGMIFGPIVQKYAFGAFWTGWPLGHDLTDNKTLAAFILWVLAYFQVRKNPRKRGWVLAAAVMLFLIYLIPHSMFGSEIDYTQENFEMVSE